MRAWFAFGAAALVALGAFVAKAEPPSGQRYEMKQVEGGFLRLDRESGLTALCKPSGDGYACQPTEEGRSADAAMVAQLEKRVAALEARIAALTAEKKALGDDARDPTLDLPSDEQVDRVAGFLERTFRRFKRLADDINKEESGSL
jgi:hypothetical protein